MIIHITRFEPYKLREFPGKNNKTGGGREMGVKYGRLPGKTGVLTGMGVTCALLGSLKTSRAATF